MATIGVMTTEFDLHCCWTDIAGSVDGSSPSTLSSCSSAQRSGTHRPKLPCWGASMLLGGAITEDLARQCRTVSSMPAVSKIAAVDGTYNMVHLDPRRRRR